MPKDAAHARSSASRTSLYGEITTKIIAELEAGRVPWVQPWGTAAAKAPLAMPKNAINVLILWGSVIDLHRLISAHGDAREAGYAI